jgi:hypothetical protein
MKRLSRLTHAGLSSFSTSPANRNHESFLGAQKASHIFLKWQVTNDVEGMCPLI